MSLQFSRVLHHPEPLLSREAEIYYTVIQSIWAFQLLLVLYWLTVPSSQLDFASEMDPIWIKVAVHVESWWIIKRSTLRHFYEICLSWVWTEVRGISKVNYLPPTCSNLTREPLLSNVFHQLMLKQQGFWEVTEITRWRDLKKGLNCTY